MDDFLRGYVATALSLLRDEEGNTFPHDYTPQDCGSLARMSKECNEFQAYNAEDLRSLDPAQAGEDFYLTRNRHGGGYWDRGLGAIGDRLTAAAHVYGGTNEYAAEGKWYSE